MRQDMWMHNIHNVCAFKWKTDYIFLLLSICFSIIYDEVYSFQLRCVISLLLQLFLFKLTQTKKNSNDNNSSNTTTTTMKTAKSQSKLKYNIIPLIYYRKYLVALLRHHSKSVLFLADFFVRPCRRRIRTFVLLLLFICLLFYVGNVR